MSKYRFIRFVVAENRDNPWWATGVFTEAQELLANHKLSKEEAREIRTIFRWFNQHIPCPPFSKNRASENWSEAAVSWFRYSIPKPISQLRPLLLILKNNGLRIRTMRANYIGKIVYRDQYQVVAETPTKA